MSVCVIFGNPDHQGRVTHLHYGWDTGTACCSVCGGVVAENECVKCGARGPWLHGQTLLSRLETA